MKVEITILAALILTASALAGTTPHKEPRLSWAPYDFLRQGYRNAPWINDPFYPQANILHLSGLISGEMAYINGRWFKLGDMVNGYEIESITGKGVTLKRRGQILVLKMDPMP